MIRKIRKRDGKVVDFNPVKITDAIWKAAQAVGGKDYRKAAQLTDKVLDMLEKTLKKGEIPSVELVQDIVEKTLIEEGHAKTAKAYILYRKQHQDIREIGGLLKDIDIVDGYLSMMDWKVNENSNMAYSLQGLNVYATENIISHYWLNKIYPPEIGDAHTRGSYHIHDLGTLGAYTYYGKETVIAKVEGKIIITSFQDLYEKIKYSEEILSVKDDAKAKYPKEIEVLDKDGWTKVFRVVKKARQKQMRYIKNEGGRSVIVTEDHPMLIEGGGVKQSRNVKQESDKLLTADLKKLLEKEKLFYKQHLYIAKELYDRGIKKFWIEGMPYEDFLEYSSNLEINGIVSTSNNADSLPNKIELTENLGYLLGFYIAEGNMDPHRISIKQKNTAEKQELFDKLTEAAYQLGCRIYTKNKNDMLELRIVNTTLVKFLLTEIFNLDGRCQEKRLPSEILTYNQDFINGLISGILDGDGSIATSNTSLVIRTASRTMLEQLGLMMNILGFTVRDRNIEGVGSTRIYNGKEIVQNYPLYGINFRTLEYSLPSLMYNNAQMSIQAWRAKGAGWHKVLNNEPTEILDDYIYDITTESNTLIVNGMWNHNCVGWDLKDILLLGFRGVSGKIESKPAKHFSTALMQIVNYLYTLQGEAAGAQALSNFDSLLAPFIRYDGLNYKDVKQEMQKFLFNMNVPTRVGFQSLAHDEPVVFRKNGKIKTELIGKLIEENFGENRKSIINNVDGYGNPSNDSFAIIPKDRYEVISFNKNGEIQWRPVKALIKHRVQTNGFKRIRTGSGDVKVSPAHSLFRSNDSHIKPVMAKELECAKPNSKLNGKNHILAVNKIKQNLLGNKESIDLFELIEELPEKIKARIFIKAKDVPAVKDKIGKLYGSLKEFVYKNGRTDKSTLYEGFRNNVVTFETYIKYSDEIRKDAKIYIKPYNENLYERNLSGEKLASFVKLVAWFITEGKASHSGIVISQEKTKSKEIIDIAKSLGINVTIGETRGYSNKTKSKTNTIISNIKMSGLYTYLLPYISGAKSKEKTVPSFIFDMNSDYRNIFLDALFKVDGYFDEVSKKITYSSMSDKLLTAISMLSVVNGWRVRVIPKSKGRAGNLLIYKNPRKDLDIVINETAGVPVYEINDYKNDLEWEYDISVDIKDCEENFVGGTGLVFYHNSPFTNITLDLTVPDYMKDEPVIIGGELKDDDYIDFSNEMDMLNKSFAEIMYEGDAKGRPFSVDGNCLCPIKNSGHTKLVRIGEYIDSLMGKNTPIFYKENGCEVLDVRGQGLKCQGIKDGKVRWENINYVVRHLQKELIKITTKGGFNIGVTSSHSLFILRQGKIQDYPASELKEGDYLISPRIIPSEEGKESISLSYEFIRKGKVDGLFISRVMKDNKVYKERRVGNGKKIHQYKVNVFPLKNIASNLKEYDLSKATLNLAGSKLKIKDSLAFTKELIEFLGWYCAEGSAEIGKKYGGISLGFNLSKEKKVAGHIAGLVKKIFKVPVFIREIKERNLIEVRVHSKLVRRILLEVFEVGNKKCKRVPSFIFETSPEKKRLFLNAYFKGDAYITEDIVVNSNSEELIYGVSTLLKQLDIFHTLTTYSSHDRKYWRINIWNNKDLVPKTSYSIAKIPVEESGLRYLATKMVEKNPFYYDSKKRRYKNTIHRQLSKFGITNQKSVGIKIAKKMLEAAKSMQIDIPSALLEIELGNLLFFKIKNIEKTVTSNGWVYDFSSDTENFIAHQFLVHNTFPIPTINITKDFKWDNENLDPIWNMTAKYGIPYFSNFINSDMKPDDVRSMCCRLRISNRELKKRGGGLFGAHPKTGSTGVVTINLPQIAYLAKDDNDFFERLDVLMDLAKQSLEIKRELIENLTLSGLHPYSRFYLSDIKKSFGEYWKNHFSTIGLVGMNDALLNFMNKSIGDKEGKAFAEKVLDHMRDKLGDYQQETGNIFNLEATPAEGSLAPDEKVLISQSDPRFNEIGPLVDNYLENNKDKIQMVGTSEVLKIPYGKMFTYGFNRNNQKIKKYPVTALVRHPGKSMYSIKTTSGRSVKVTGQHSVFTLNSEGIIKEVLVSNLRVGAPIAIPKKIEIETVNKEFNLIELFKKSSFNKYLYGIFPISFIEKLIEDINVKKWCDKNYKSKWSDIKRLWMKRGVIPLKLIYDLNIKINKETLLPSKIFYRYTKNTRPINAIIPINEDFGFTVGCLLYEGWLTERSNFNNTNEEFAKEFFKSTEKIFGSKSVYLAFSERKKPRKNIYKITLSKSIGLFFKEIGLVGKSNEKQVPNFVFSSNLDCAAGLLKGYYLGDGSFYKNKEKNDYSVDLYSNSKKLIDGLNLLLLRFGILTKIREDKKSKNNPKWNDNYYISITGAENLEVFFGKVVRDKFQIGKTHSARYTIPEVPKLIKQIMKKHKIKPCDLNIWKDSFNKNVRLNRISIQYLQEIVHKLSNHINDKDEALEQLKLLVNSDIYWDRIKEIKELKPTKYVYDFEVDVMDDQVNNFLGGSGLVCLHNTSYRLARIDKSTYPDIRIYNQEKYNGGHRGDVEPYYTNSTQLPVGFTDDIFEALDLQDSLQSKYTGGTVLHIFVNEHEPDPHATKKLIRKVAENYTLPYYTITPTFSICPKHGYIAGEHRYCPKCDEEIGYIGGI